jgi:hypothetical protein
MMSLQVLVLTGALLTASASPNIVQYDDALLSVSQTLDFNQPLENQVKTLDLYSEPCSNLQSG